jgi:hypothetical protein
MMDKTKRVKGCVKNPQVVLKSFTATWLAFFCGNLTKDEQDYGQFWFNCAREHVLGGTTPMEAAWAILSPAARPPTREDCSIDPEQLPADVWKAYMAFRLVLEVADAEGRVSWKSGRNSEK